MQVQKRPVPYYGEQAFSLVGVGLCHGRGVYGSELATLHNEVNGFKCAVRGVGEFDKKLFTSAVGCDDADVWNAELFTGDTGVLVVIIIWEHMDN